MSKKLTMYKVYDPKSCCYISGCNRDTDYYPTRVGATRFAERCVKEGYFGCGSELEIHTVKFKVTQKDTIRDD
jgi:hypothetical protein